MAEAPKPLKATYSVSRRETVNHPLTPSMLSEMGALEAAPLPSGPFESAGRWTHAYRIWTCYGYRDRSNRDQGTLTIRRSRGDQADAVHLAVEQTVQMDPRKAGDVHHVAAEIRCRYDKLASPTSWTLSSWFGQGADAKRMAELDHAEQAQRKGRKLVVEIGGQRFEREVSERFTADWCLFDAVQRLPFGTDDVCEFDLLEGLTGWKPGQRLCYRGKMPSTWGKQPARLHCFQQLGTGVWPYEYWLDEQHRMVMAITGARVYIWEPAEGGEK